LDPGSLRTIVYIDGFNLYYGTVKGGPHKWLDVELFCRRLRNDDAIVRIHYFTSTVAGSRAVRQRVFLDALRTRPMIRITLGQFKLKTITCENSRCDFQGDRTFTKPEEKRTDVAIGIQMLDDAYQDACDRFVLITGDSDLVPAVQRIRKRFPKKKIITYRPVGDHAIKARRGDELADASGDGRVLPRALFAHCHLPDPVIGEGGKELWKPGSW
jgi:hypothetical protein